MTEQIGKVTLNYTYYDGLDNYSDGPIEDDMLAIAKSGTIEAALREGTAWPVLYHFSPVRKHILDWYPMPKDATVLEIGAGCGAITGVLSRKAKRVVCIELSKKRSMINAYQNQECDNVEIYVGKYEDVKLEEKFDYITLIGVLEYAAYYTHADNPYTDMLQQIRGMLKPGGKLLIAIENRMGLKYLNGANEDHTATLFDGIHNYARKNAARTFTKPELSGLLEASGLSHYQFFYPMPDYKLPYFILSDNCATDIGGMIDLDIAYDNYRMEFFDEATVYNTLQRDGLFGYFANSFFVEAGVDTADTPIGYARYSLARNPEYQTRTLLYTNVDSPYAVKSPIRPEGTAFISAFADKYERIRDMYPNMTIVAPTLSADGVCFPLIAGRDLTNILADLQYDQTRLLATLGRYMEQILCFRDEYLTEFHSSPAFETVFGNIPMGPVPAVTCANIDTTLDNILEQDGQLYCIDYEWTFDCNIPIVYLKFRLLSYFFLKAKQYLSFSDIGEFLIHYGLCEEEILLCNRMEENFLTYIRSACDNPQSNYAKPTIHFSDYQMTFEKTLKEKELLEEETERLQSKLAETEAKLSRHLTNETRLRNVIQKLKTQ